VVYNAEVQAMLYRLVRPMQRKGSRNVYFQQRIPADVKQAAIGRRLEFLVGGETVRFAVTEQSHAIKFSLRTFDPAEVKLRQAEAARQAELHWTALRQTKPVTLSHRQCVALSERAYQAWASGERETTTAMERVPVGRIKPGEAAKVWQWQPTGGATMDGEPEAWTAAAKRVDPERLGPLADRLLLAEGINGLDGLDADSREMLLNEIAKALRQAFGVRQRNAEGDYGPGPLADRFPSEFQRQGHDSRSSSSPSLSPVKVSLMALVEDWWREAKAGGMSLSTYESYRNTVRKFGQFLKHDDAGRVSTEDVIRYKDWRIANGINPWTVKAKDIAALRMVFAWAVSNRRLAANPAEGITLRVGKRIKLRGDSLTEEEARAVLSAALHLQRGKEAAKTFEVKRWVPWLCAYTGARVGEIVQLRKQDVRWDVGLGGAIVITITPEAGTVKTKEMREVVLHEHLEAMGFRQFVERSRAGYLFLNVSPEGEWASERRGKWRAAKNRLS
jgi:site-specific recombinase XerD